MAEDTQEFTGKTVDEAVAEGLRKLNMSRSDVAVEVLSKGSRGIFGIGSEPARIRITIEPTPAPARTTATDEAVVFEETQIAASEPDVSAEATAGPAETETDTETVEETVEETSDRVDVEIAEEVVYTVGAEDKAEVEEVVEVETQQPERTAAVEVSDDELTTMSAEMLGEIVRLMGFEADVVTSWQDPDDEGSPYLVLDIEGENLGALIGRRGETLANLQYLVRLMVNQRIKQWRNIVVDVEKYKERREIQLNQLALRMADQVADSGRATALEPMPPAERRLVHIALRDHPQVYTQSSGEDDRRKVNIVPKDTV